MNGRERIAKNLRRIRIERALSQESLAVDADVDRTYVSGLEREEFNPSVDLLERLAGALKVDLADFFLIPNAKDPAPEPLKRGRKPGAR